MQNKNKKQKNPYKVAMIGQKRIPSREGGVEVVVGQLSERLVAEGYAVDAYNRSGYHVSGKEYDRQGKSRYYKGIRLIVIPTFENGKLNAIVYSTLATLRALWGRYDVIHYHAEGPCATLFLPRLFGIRVIATIHGLDWQRAKWGNFASRVLKFGEKMAARKANEVIVLSRNVQAYFKETYGRDTHYIPNGISKPEYREVKLIMEYYGLKRDGYILFLARLVPEKGLHYLLEAFAGLETDKKLVIAGGSSHAFEYMERVREQAGRDSRVIMTGFVQGRVLEELYSNAYCFVLPSDTEGMAISLLEAMSYGNCCLVSDIAENVEVTGDKAAVFKKGEVKDLREKLKTLIEDEQLVAAYKNTASDYICGKYSWEKMTEQTLELYGFP